MAIGRTLLRALGAFLRATALTIAALLVLATISMAGGKFSLAAGCVILFVSLLSFTPLRGRWSPGRPTATGLAFVSIIAAIGSWGIIKKEEQTRISALRESDPRAYLAAIKGGVEDAFYLEELAKLDGALYQAELHRRETETKADRERRVAAERLEEERRIAAVQKELTDLKTRLDSVPALPLTDQLSIYTRLSDLDPKTEHYKRERDRLTPLVRAQEEKDFRIREEETRTADARTNPDRFLEISRFSWSKGGFGSIMVATFVVKNTSPVNIKDISIHCTHAAPSGTVIDSNTRIIYDVVKANSTKTFREVNMGFVHSQASSSGCSILSARAM